MLRKLTLSIVVLLISFSSFSQTKKERKMETKKMETGMYNSSESVEAREYFDKGCVYADKGDYKVAVKWYKKALEEDSLFIEAYDNMGAAYRKSGDLENAKKCYNKSIELYPEGNMAHQNLAIVYQIEKKYDKALEQYEIMQENDPNDPEGYYGAIQINLFLGNFDDAISAAMKTMEIYEETESPYLSDAQYLLGLSYYYNGDNENAKLYIKEARKNGAPVPEEILNKLGLK